MTSGKAALLTASLVGVVALGVVAAPTIRNHWSKMDTPATTASAPADTSATTPAKAKRPAHRATTSRDAMTVKKETGKVDIVAVSVWQPELRDRVKKVLNPGARLELAAEDFTSAEQFVTVAHAARNTQVPFAVPTDPQTSTLSEWFESRGLNAFNLIAIPHALRTLTQFAGRLIRTSTDTGRVIILDSRLLTRRYGKRIIDALPPFKRTIG